MQWLTTSTLALLSMGCVMATSIAPIEAQETGPPENARQGLRDRASCADVELAEALGEPFDAAEKARCDSMRASRPTQRRKNPPPAALPPAIVPAEVGVEIVVEVDPEVVRPRPGWIDSVPRASGKLHGVGRGADIASAFGDATRMIAAQLAVEVRSTLVDAQAEKGVFHGDVEVESVAREKVSRVTQTLVRNTLSNVEMVDQWREPDGGFHWVLTRYDQSRLEAERQAIIDAALGALADASERLRLHLTEENVLDQGALLDLLAVLNDVKAMGRSKAFKGLAKEWRKPHRKLKKTVQRALACVSAEPLDGAPSAGTLEPGDLVLRLHCNGKPLAGAQMSAALDGGMASIPATLAADSEGVVRFKTGTVYGGGTVGLTFQHDLRGAPGAYFANGLTLPASATVRLRTHRAPEVTVEVTGVKGADLKRVRGAFTDWLRRRHGARVVSSGAVLTASLRVDLGASVEVSDKVTQSMEWHLHLQGPDGTLVSSRGSAGALSKNRRDARSDAFANLIQRINRW
jgi:hypothetical protein